MKIIKHAEFLKLPPGVPFCKYSERRGMEDLMCIKGSSLPCGDTEFRDFIYTETMQIESRSSEDAELLFDRMQHDGESVPADVHSGGRDGCFDDSQLYLVFEEADHLKLIERLRDALVDRATLTPAGGVK